MITGRINQIAPCCAVCAAPLPGCGRRARRRPGGRVGRVFVRAFAGSARRLSVAEASRANGCPDALAPQRPATMLTSAECYVGCHHLATFGEPRTLS